MKNGALTLVVLLAMASGALRGQTKTGTAVGDFLLIEPSAQIAGMGNAGVTIAGSVQSAYYNPAAIGQSESSGLEFTHSLWLADITYDYVGGILALGNLGNVFASVTALNSGEIDVRTVEQPLGTGERYTVSDLAFGLGYGRRVSERFSLGLQFTYLQETIWHSAMSAFAVNVGTLYMISPDGLRIGASISNWGSRAKFDGRDLRILYDQSPALHGQNASLPAELFTDDFPLPIIFRVGIGMPITIDSRNKLYLAADAFHPSDNRESISVGAQWTFFDIFSVRGGYQNLFMADSELGLTLGAGLQYSMDDNVTVHFDYGWADAGRLQKTQRMTLGVMF